MKQSLEYQYCFKEILLRSELLIRVQLQCWLAYLVCIQKTDAHHLIAHQSYVFHCTHIFTGGIL